MFRGLRFYSIIMSLRVRRPRNEKSSDRDESTTIEFVDPDLVTYVKVSSIWGLEMRSLTRQAYK